MKLRTILLVFLILAAFGVAIASAKADGAGDGMGLQVQGENQTQDQIRDHPADRVRNETDRLSENRTAEQNRTHEQLGEQDRLQNQTLAMNITILHQRIQDRRLEQEREWENLSAEHRNVYARYSNVSAFVHLLLNESKAEALLGNRSGGIGPQVSAYARGFNNSVTAQVGIEERIETRNGFVRFIAGGDDDAAAALEEEVDENQERIAAMQQLIQQYQGGDPAIKAAFQEELQNMMTQQEEVRQRAVREREDKGIIGWLWK